MKLLYSQLKQLVPGLKATPKQIGEKFTMTGLMMDELKKVNYLGKPDYLISLEVRQNRPDCLGIIGLAREVAAFYGLRCRLPEQKNSFIGTAKNKITVEAKNQIKRALAYEIAGVKNRQSPSWLKDFLAFYDINSVNLLVDLSNYAMIFTGYPSHLLDKDKMAGDLRWSINNGFKATNKDFKTITTLDDTRVNLLGGEIILCDNKNILGLAGIVGGKQAAIGLETQDIIAEMAIYDQALVRQNSRSLKITTEASIRLEKDLDPNGLDLAMNFLVSLIIKETGGKIIGKPFSYYPKKALIRKINFDPASPSVFAGIEIKPAPSLKILRNLRFNVKQLSPKLWQIEPPTDRTDIVIPEDVIEEVIRINGYEKIPQNQIPAFKAAEDITPRIILLADRTRDILVFLGFDEVLSWPLTKKEINSAVRWQTRESIPAQNSVNEEFPDLRESIASGLLSQLKEYEKKNVGEINIFEIGRIFCKEKERYAEYDNLGLLIKSKNGRSIKELKAAIEKLLRSLGFSAIIYSQSVIKPRTANPISCWNIFVGGKLAGIIYKLKSSESKETAFAELRLSELSEISNKSRINPAAELEQKLVVLDANIELEKDASVSAYLASMENKIGEKNLWAAEISDRFPIGQKTRYTIRVTYKGLSDKEAKALHTRIFNKQ